MLELKNLSVPEYNQSVFREKRTNYCLIIPTFNEGERFLSQISKMKKNGIFNIVDVIIADAGSNDGSMEQHNLSSIGFRALLTRKGNGRYSTDMRMGWYWALNEGYTGFIMVDGNDKDDVSKIAIESFIKKLDEGFDYIQGSRFVKGGKAVRTPLSRLIAIKCICAPIMAIAGGRWVTDGTNGFRAYSKKFLLDERVNPFRSCFNKYEVTYYLPPRAGKLKFKCIEIPVTRIYPESGEIPTKANAKANWEVIILLIKILFGRLNPRKEQQFKSK